MKIDHVHNLWIATSFDGLKHPYQISNIKYIFDAHKIHSFDAHKIIPIKYQIYINI